MKKDEMRESPAGRSMINLYVNCPRKWAFKYLSGFKLAKEADHLKYGSAVHEAQAVFYQENFDLKKARDEIEKFFGKNTSQKELRDKAIKALDIWYAEIGTYDQENCKVLEVEEESYLELPNGFKMTVRRDGVLEDLLVGEVFIRDTKTTGWSLEGTIKNYMFSDQPKLYILSAEQQEPDWINKLSGWRTDCIYNRSSVWKAQRSDLSTFTRDQLMDTIDTYASITSDMAFKIRSVLEGGEQPSIHFHCNNNHCLAYNKECEYAKFCHEINSLTLPPSGFEIDDWLAQGTVLDAFKGVE